MVRLRSAIVIFGSKVNSDGKPSKSLLRRTLGAAHYARAQSLDTYYIVSGGLGDHPPSEAIVMKKILFDEGVDEADIILDENSFDTFDTVVNCKQTLDELDVADVYVCSDDYHVPRCLMLMAMLYKRSKPIYVNGSRNSNGNFKWIYYCLREAVAIIWDAFLALRYRIT